MRSLTSFYVCILSVVILKNVFAQEISDEFSNFEIQDEKYLSDFPILSPESLRYLLPAPNWASNLKYTAKGKYIQIFKENINSRIKLYEGPLNFYEDKNLKGDPILTYFNGAVKFKGNDVCTIQEKRKISDGAYECQNFTCHYVKGKHELTNFYGLKINHCKYWPELYDSSRYPDFYSVNVKVLDNSLLGNFAETRIGDKSYFLDIRFCKSNPIACKPLTIKYSRLEQAWMNLKYVQLYKKYPLFNHLEEKLLPCVKKKDTQCVRKFFITQKEAEIFDNIKIRKTFSAITDTTFRDLESCLKYENLLPFGRRSKATDDKICIFSSSLEKIYSITFPDAYRVNGPPIFVNYGK